MASGSPVHRPTATLLMRATDKNFDATLERVRGCSLRVQVKGARSPHHAGCGAPKLQRSNVGMLTRAATSHSDLTSSNTRHPDLPLFVNALFAGAKSLSLDFSSSTSSSCTR